MNSKEFHMRKGRFFISTDLLNNNRSLKIMIRAFIWLQFIPIDVRWDFIHHRFEYTGYSPRFEPIEEGSIMPVYVLKTNIIKNKLKFNLRKIGIIDFSVDMSLSS